MLKGLSLVELAKKLEANAANKKDFIANANTDLSMLAGQREVVMAVRDQGSYPMRPLAHDQLGSVLKIPAVYYDRMRAEDPTLLATNVNHWLSKESSKRMVRTLDGQMRAFLTNRYQRIENEEIAQMALPILLEIPGLQIISSEVTEKRLYIQAVTPRIAGQVKVGDEVQAGLIIRNSEVGLGMASVQPIVYRLICLNGMVFNDGKFNARHVGKRVEDNEALWADDTRRADDKAILLKVRDSIKYALDATVFKNRVAAMASLTEGKVTGDPTKAVEVLGSKLGGVTETESSGILRALIEGADLSRYGLLNAVTAQANTAQSYDRAVEFEEMGGKVLDLSKKDWTEVLEAA